MSTTNAEKGLPLEEVARRERIYQYLMAHKDEILAAAKERAAQIIAENLDQHEKGGARRTKGL
jgi:hypothetical protein